MNGNSGIVPTVDLATNNNSGYAYPYPVYPMASGFGNGGFGGFGGDSAIWLIVLLALIWGNNGNNGGFFGGNNSFDNGYAWLSNGQKEIMSNTNNGFDTLHLSNQLDTVNSGIYSLSNQLCNCCSDMQQTVSNGFANAEVSANARQIADMNQSFNNQIATLQGFNGMQKSLDNCCCENRLGIANLGADIAREACADRQAVNDGVRDILANQTASVQRILDQLCQDKIDAKNDTIAQLRQELLYARGQASQTAQTATLLNDNLRQTSVLEDYLNPVPRPAYIVQNPNCCINNGCGCNGYNGII